MVIFTLNEAIQLIAKVENLTWDFLLIQRVDNVICWINSSKIESAVHVRFIDIYPLDSDLSLG